MPQSARGSVSTWNAGKTGARATTDIPVRTGRFTKLEGWVVTGAGDPRRDRPTADVRSGALAWLPPPSPATSQLGGSVPPRVVLGGLGRWHSGAPLPLPSSCTTCLSLLSIRRGLYLPPGCHWSCRSLGQQIWDFILHKKKKPLFLLRSHD